MSGTRTPLRSVRVPDEVWQAAQEAATANGTTVSAVIVTALTRYGRPAPTRRTTRKAAK